MADDNGRTPIYYAIVDSKIEILKLFVEDGIDLEQSCDANDATSLQVAIEYKLGPIVTFLINKGAKTENAVRMAVAVGWDEGPKLICNATFGVFESTWKDMRFGIIGQQD